MLKNKINIALIISLLFILFKINFFNDISQILNVNYTKRISNVYGFCEREGIGYVNFIKEKFNVDKKIDLINSLKRNNNNSGEWAIYNTNFLENDKSDYLIVINYKKLSNKIDLDKFKIIHNFEDCYFLEKND
tara:strand:- start:235 stop:633 length:399 start_codon:yes stop_codon:yes gene_type:complete